MSTGRFFIYGLVDPRTGHLRYVGKTERALSVRLANHIHRALRQKTNEHKRNWIRKMIAEGLRPQIVQLWETSDVDILSQAECFWIKYFRQMGCNLTNATDGGEGSTGYRHSEEEKKRISKRQKGKLWSLERRKGRSPVTSEQVKEIIELYRGGLSIEGIAQAFGNLKGMRSGGIRKVLLRAGQDMRQPWAKGPKRGPPCKLNAENEKKVIEGYIGGSSSSSLASEFGVSDKTIRRILHTNQVKMRNCGEGRWLSEKQRGHKQ